MEKASGKMPFDFMDFFSETGKSEGDLNLKLQISTYLLSMVHFYRLRDAGWTPDIFAEHSMGIYAALAASEAITFEEGLFITQAIGRLLEKEGVHHQGAMVSIIGLPLEEIQTLCHDLNGYPLSIANHNGSMQYVLSGDEKAIEKAIELALSRKAISANRLAFNTALHSPPLLSLRDDILKLLKEIEIRAPRFPILNHWTIQTLKKEEIKDFLSQEIARPVYWVQCVEKLIQEGIRQFIEVGQESTLTKLIRWIDREAEVFSAGDGLRGKGIK